MIIKQFAIQRFKTLLKAIGYCAVFSLFSAVAIVAAIDYPLHFLAFLVGFVTGSRQIAPHLKAFFSNWLHLIRPNHTAFHPGT